MLNAVLNKKQLYYKIANDHLNRKFSEFRTADGPKVEEDYRLSTLSEIMANLNTNTLMLVDPSFFCNFRCSYCALPVTKKFGLEWENMQAILKAYQFCGGRKSLIFGGEPSIFPSIDLIINDLSKYRTFPVMFTNGLWASSRKRLDKFLTAGLFGVEMSLKAFSDETYAQISGVRIDYRKVESSLKNLLIYHQKGLLKEFKINHVITQTTLKELDRIVDYDFPSISFSLVEPYTLSSQTMIPKGKNLMEKLKTVLEKLLAQGTKVEIDGIPLCMLNEFSKFSREQYRHLDNETRLYLKPGQDADFVLLYRGYQRLLQFKHVDTCKKCSQLEICPGPHMFSGVEYEREGLLNPYV